MNFDLMIERLVQFRNRLEHFGPLAATVSLLILVAIFVISVSITHREPPPFSEILPGFSPANWVWDITALCLLFAMTLPEYVGLCTEKHTWVSFSIRIFHLTHWILQWVLWVIVVYFCVIFSYAILAWLVSVLL